MKKTILIAMLLIISPLSFADDKTKEQGVMITDNTIKNYSKADWEEASANEGITVVQFHAAWCSTCRTQHKTIEEIAKGNEFKAVKFFQIDFDKEELLKQNLGVTQQSTIIVFKGKKEVTRAIGDTATDAISDLVSNAL